MYNETDLKRNLEIIRAIYGGNDEDKIINLINNADTVNCTDSNNKTLLHHAALWGMTRVITALFAKGAKALVNNEDNDCKTPLHSAVLSRKIEAVKTLLDGGANINVSSENYGTPLYMAASNGYLEIVALLIEKNAVIDATCKPLGCTPLHIAAYRGYSEIVSLLIKKGAKINLKDSEGLTPLYCAAGNEKTGCNEQIEVFNTLINNDADVNISDRDGNTPLHIAVKKNNSKIVKLLLGCDKIDLNKQNHNGDTPLHFAYLINAKEIINLLIDKGADNKIPNKDGQTPESIKLINGINYNINYFAERQRSKSEPIFKRPPENRHLSTLAYDKEAAETLGVQNLSGHNINDDLSTVVTPQLLPELEFRNESNDLTEELYDSRLHAQTIRNTAAPDEMIIPENNYKAAAQPPTPSQEDTSPIIESRNELTPTPIVRNTNNLQVKITKVNNITPLNNIKPTVSNVNNTNNINCFFNKIAISLFCSAMFNGMRYSIDRYKLFEKSFKSTLLNSVAKHVSGASLEPLKKVICRFLINASVITVVLLAVEVVMSTAKPTIIE